MIKPRKAKVKLSRVVTEIAIVLLDKDGCIEEILSVIETLSVHP